MLDKVLARAERALSSRRRPLAAALAPAADATI